MSTTHADTMEAIAAWQAVTGSTTPPELHVLVAWLLKRARTAEAALQRASDSAQALCRRAGDLAEMTAYDLRAAQMGTPLPPPKGNRIKFAGWTLDTMERTLTAPSGMDIVLTTTEYEILATLLRAPNKVMTRETISELALGRSLGQDDRTIDINIVRLRRKLEMDPKNPVLIKTIYGQGYLFTKEVSPAYSMRRNPAPDHQPVEMLIGDAWILEVGNVEHL